MMDFKKVIGTIAPFIGGMVGGPFGAAAGKLIGSALLGNENATQEDIENAIGVATPEQLVKLKQIDAQTKIKYAEIGLDEKKIAALDRDSAREREIKTGDSTPKYLAWFITLGFFGILTTIVFFGGAIPLQILSAVNILLGALVTAWIGVVTYYFGSSAGSDKKDILLKEKKA